MSEQPSPEALAEVERALGHRFADPAWLIEALTHPSWTVEHGGRDAHNQRLEFLGDAVLGCVIASALHRREGAADEGMMSRARARLVSAPSLARAAREAGLGRHLRMGRGETADRGDERRGNLADLFEALVGAVFRDGGFDAAEAVVLRLLAAPLREVTWDTPRSDYKTALQEWTQAHDGQRPAYRVVASRGPAHALEFDVEVTIGGQVVARGEGSSKKRAEQAAARLALEALTSGTMAVNDAQGAASTDAPGPAST